jgi:hypothetical protein
VITGLIGALLFAQAAGTALQPRADEEIQKHQFAIAEDAPGVYSGPGWDRLIADAAAAQFFMIGEQHGTADIAQFAMAAHKALSSKGYTHAAYEVGPYSTDFAEDLIRSGKGRLAKYIEQPGHGIILPFLFFEEEVRLAEQIVGSSPDRKDAIWGLDQEFIASGPLVGELLRQWSNSPKQRAAAQKFSQMVAANPMLIGAQPWSELEFLETAFVGNRRAAELVGALRASNRIYSPFTGRGGSGYDGNLERETNMKRYFAARFMDAERRNQRPPKVFMKFGGYHGQKGFTGTNVPGLGNFLAEWGVPRGMSYLNVMVECVGGQAMNPVENKSAPCEPYFRKDSVIARLSKPDKMTLLDLRPLRSQLDRLKDLDPQTRQLILSYDYYLAIKDVKPATPVAAAK